MPTLVHDFDWPDRFVVGTIGVPGARTFYLQVRAGAQLISFVLEKQQSTDLAEKIDEILDELRSLEGNPYSVPTSTPIELVDNEPLEPAHEQFRIGIMSLGWDPTSAQIILEAYPVTIVDAEDEFSLEQDSGDADEVLRVRIPVGAARAFAKRTREVVGAGRPACPLCGFPMDPDGHVCTLPEV
ncbi:DUF3090 domain-containing protein [Neomicrococcus lactis]